MERDGGEEGRTVKTPETGGHVEGVVVEVRLGRSRGSLVLDG